MTYFYVKALHIIFVITWFGGLFYIVRLFIYNREAIDKPEPEKSILTKQFNLMIHRLWYIITWPSCLLAMIFGTGLIVYNYPVPGWLWTKLGFVVGLFMYHLSLHKIYQQQKAGVFRHTSQQLRLWNELATIFLVAIIMLVVVRTGLGLLWGLVGLAVLVIVLMVGIRVYKKIRRS